jgi:hypothetical protein
MKNFFNKRDNLFLILFISFAIIYVMLLGAYPLLEPDETRYVTMARDMFTSGNYLTLYLNGEYFFEKPPLFFWLESLSFWFFKDISEFTARFPVVILSLLPLGLLFFLSEKVKNQKFAFLNSAILLTTLEYVLITKIAMLDSVLTSLVSSSVLCYFFTFFVSEENKKYFWYSCYILMGLAVLAKGIPGVVIPAGTILAGTIIFRTYKETLKNMPVGIVLFLIIALPWHIIMLLKHGSRFFNEYIIKHHLMRFLGAEVIHRNEPVYFYFVTLLWGLFPWIFSLLSSLRKPRKFNLENRYDKFLVLNITAILVILLFFSCSGAKLITYILPVYPFFAVLIGHIWYERSMKKFMVIVAVMTILGGFASPFGYKLDYSFGQNDLMQFAKMAKDNNYTISTYKTGKKYSLLYYSGLKNVEFQTGENPEWLRNELCRKNNYLIVRNKEIKDLPVNTEIVKQGVKYSIIKSPEV